jgi:hypothetical protein
MARRIPSDAFDFYVGLGPQRSYQTVAKHYGVTKRAVVKAATKGEWQRRAQDIEEKARHAANTTETRESMDRRHRKTIEYVQSRALEALRSMPMRNAMDAIRALDISIREERSIIGADDEPAAEEERKGYGSPAHLSPELKVLRRKILREYPGWDGSVRFATEQERHSPGSLAALEEQIEWLRPYYFRDHPGSTEYDYRNEDHGCDILPTMDLEREREERENSNPR